jgi:alkylation response protein AidB-like acyl-CoA dehydrogenase
MNFALTDELLALQETARRFAETELVQKARDMDRAEKFDPGVFRKMAEQGFAGVTIPSEYNGAGLVDEKLGNQGACIVLEEINRRCASTGVTLSVHMSLFSSALNKWGSHELKNRYLPDMAVGNKIGAYCLSEAGAGTDAGSLAATARKDGDAYILNGVKLWITSGEYANTFLVMARTGTSGKPKDISSFIVDADAKGVRVSKKEKKMGIRASATNEIVLEDVRVPANNLIGEEGIGFKIALDTLDGGRIGIAAQAVGIARAAMEDAIAYSKEREQFGTKIGTFQAIQFKIADMAMRIDASRLLMYRAAWLRDNGLPCGKEAAMAKLMASETANYCAKEAVQIYGGNGYSKEYDVERYFRDARITEIYEGTSEVQRIVISRGVMA